MVEDDRFGDVRIFCAPPKHWVQIVDGHKITPRVIHQTLKHCREAGVDMEYVAEQLCVGSQAMIEYLSNERTIPSHIAERFYEFFSKVKTLPKAPPEKQRPTLWEETAESRAQKKPTKRAAAPDFDAVPLGKLLKERRLAKNMSLIAAGKIAKCSPAYVAKIEGGGAAYQHTNCKSIYRLCEFFDVDIRDYELKPRVDFLKFQRIVQERKKASGETWIDLSKRTGVARGWVHTYLATAKPHVEITYLDYHVEDVMAAYGLDVNTVLLTKGTAKREECVRDEQRTEAEAVSI